MIECEKCGKIISYEDSWNWTELGVTTSFCSNECLNKWIQKTRPTIPTEGIEITHTELLGE